MQKFALSLAFLLMAGSAQAQTQPPARAPAITIPAPAAAQAPSAPSQPSGSPLPGGVASITESYGDWRVLCSAPNNAKQCTIQQIKVDNKTGQRVLVVELAPTANGGVWGNMVLPFGLLLSGGVSIALDQNAAGPPQMFQTCIPAGCIVPITLDANTVSYLRKGNELKLTARPVNASASPVVLSLSLKGFGDALDRTVAILR